MSVGLRGGGEAGLELTTPSLSAEYRKKVILGTFGRGRPLKP